MVSFFKIFISKIFGQPVNTVIVTYFYGTVFTIVSTVRETHKKKLNTIFFCLHLTYFSSEHITRQCCFDSL
jgi:hypothetical protein